MPYAVIARAMREETLTRVGPINGLAEIGLNFANSLHELLPRGHQGR